MRGRFLPFAQAFIMALIWLLTSAAPAPAQQVVDKYQEFMANNPAVANAKHQETINLINFLQSNGVPVHTWECKPYLIKVEMVTLGTPTCGSCTNGPGPVVMIAPGYQLPQGYIKAYVFGVFTGSISFVGTYPGGSLNESPDVTGNVFAGSIAEGGGMCYAQTSLGLWSHETRNEYLLPHAYNGPFLECNNVFFVLASDFQGAPEGVFSQFQQMFQYLTQL